MSITNDSKKALRAQIQDINGEITRWKDKLDIFKAKKVKIQEKIDLCQQRKSEFQAKKQNLQDDINAL